MFSRWRQENFFRYQRAHYALDALDTYDKTTDDPQRLVPNPARKDADRQPRQARAVIEAAEAEEGRAALAGRRDRHRAAEIDPAFNDARAELARREAAARAIPAKVPLGDLHPDAARLDPERKGITDAIRLATYNAETATARLLAPHYARADDEARRLLREMFWPVVSRTVTLPSLASEPRSRILAFPRISEVSSGERFAHMRFTPAESRV